MLASEGTHQHLDQYIRAVPDWPAAGVTFRDLTPLFADANGWRSVIDALCQTIVHLGADVIVGVEARGFVVAAPVSYALGLSFVPVRKPNKLPSGTIQESYQLEYGTDSLEMHADAISAGQRVVIIDDVLATGGTASASINLASRLGAEIVGLAFVAEIQPLGGRKIVQDRLPDVDISSLIVYR
jgi:adenine phosphoribosyltransferase